MWIKQDFHFTGLTTLFINTKTGERIQKTTIGQCFVFNTTKLCAEPTNAFPIRTFEGWDFFAGSHDDFDSLGHYCCDGDGFVTVELLTDGSIQLHDQGMYMLDLSSTLDEAMQQATDYIKEQYPSIYEDFLSFVDAE
jgi:hypothetical protein